MNRGSGPPEPSAHRRMISPVLARLAELLKLDDPLAAQLLASYSYDFSEEEWKLSVWSSVIHEIAANRLDGNFLLTPRHITTAANDTARSAGSRVVFSTGAVGDIARGLLNKRILLRLRDCLNHSISAMWDSQPPRETSGRCSSVASSEKLQRLCGRQQTDVTLPLPGFESSWASRISSWLLSHWFPPSLPPPSLTVASGTDIALPSSTPSILAIRREFTIPFVDAPSTDTIDDASEVFVFLPILEALASKFIAAVLEGHLMTPSSSPDQSPRSVPPNKSKESSQETVDETQGYACASVAQRIRRRRPLDDARQHMPPKAAQSCDFSVGVPVIRHFLETNIHCDVISQNHIEIFLWYLSFFTGVVRPFCCQLGSLADSKTTQKQVDTPSGLADQTSLCTLQFVKISPDRMTRGCSSSASILEVTDNDRAAALEWHASRRLNHRLTALCSRCNELDTKCRQLLAQQHREAALLWLRQKRYLQDEITQVTQQIFRIEEAAQMRNSTMAMAVVAAVLQTTVGVTKTAVNPDKVLRTLEEVKDAMDDVKEIHDAFAEATKFHSTPAEEAEIEEELATLVREVAAQEDREAAVEVRQATEEEGISSGARVEALLAEAPVVPVNPIGSANAGGLQLGDDDFGGKQRSARSEAVLNV